MVRMQFRLPEPLYQRAKAVAAKRNLPLAEMVRRALKHYLDRFASDMAPGSTWEFPVLELGGDFLIDPSDIELEAEAMTHRALATSP